jgi:hypothetical protein
MQIAIFAVLLVLVILVAVNMARSRQAGDSGAQLSASLKQAFLDFQAEMNRQLSTTREEVGRSKDICR